MIRRFAKKKIKKFLKFAGQVAHENYHRKNDPDSE
jgi:hypothetical protein